MQIEISGPAFGDVNDVVEIGDDIRRGDIVWFDRVERGKLVMRRARPEVSGVCYRIDPRSDADTLRLVLVE